MLRPLVVQQPGIGIDIAVLRWIGRAGSIGTVLRIGTVVVLRPQAVQDKGGMDGALRRRGVRMAVFRRPRQAQEIKVELSAGMRRLRTIGGRCRRRSAGPWSCGRLARNQRKKKKRENKAALLHAGSIAERCKRVFNRATFSSMMD
jgi:hypothetical protein